MTNTTSGGFIDGNRSCSLDDVGAENMLAATLIGADWTCLAIVDTEKIGDGTPIDAHCRDVAHEQLGALPIECVRRITIAQRRIIHRCGRPTRSSGQPCRHPVQRPGDRCSLHRDEASR